MSDDIYGINGIVISTVLGNFSDGRCIQVNMLAKKIGVSDSEKVNFITVDSVKIFTEKGSFEMNRNDVSLFLTSLYDLTMELKDKTPKELQDIHDKKHKIVWAELQDSFV